MTRTKTDKRSLKRITKAETQWLDAIYEAARHKALALMAGRIRSTGEDVAIVCIMHPTGDGDYIMAPMCHIPLDNPMTHYVSALEIDEEVGRDSSP